MICKVRCTEGDAESPSTSLIVVTVSSPVQDAKTQSLVCLCPCLMFQLSIRQRQSNDRIGRLFLLDAGLEDWNLHLQSHLQSHPQSSYFSFA